MPTWNFAFSHMHMRSVSEALILSRPQAELPTLQPILDSSAFIYVRTRTIVLTESANQKLASGRISNTDA